MGSPRDYSDTLESNVGSGSSSKERGSTMAVDTRKLKDKANALYLKGKIKDAVKILEQVMQADKKDVKTLVKLGDLYKKLDDKDKAIRNYHRAAQYYAAQGFLVNAISVNKMIIELDPNHQATQEALADLFAKREEARAGSEAAPAPGHVRGASLEMLERFKKKPAGAAGAPSAPETTPQDSPAVPTPSEAELQAEEIEDDPLELEADDVLAQLPRIPLFSHLERDEFIRVIDQLEVQLYDAGDLILCEGDHGNSFYVITRGTAVVTKRSPGGEMLEVAELGEGNFFGEFAFLADSDRKASVLAKTELEVLEFSREKLDQLMSEYPRVKDVMLEFYRERVMKTLMAISPLFEPFQESEKQELLERFEALELPAGKRVIEEGTEGDGLYLIMNGAVRVLKQGPDGEPVELATLREGEFFGEMSLLLRQKTTATVETTEPTQCFRLSKATFNELILTHPQILEVVAEFSDQRQQKNQKVLAGASHMAASGMV